MTAWSDRHPAPNIDVACIKLFGQAAALPAGLQLGRRREGHGLPGR